MHRVIVNLEQVYFEDIDRCGAGWFEWFDTRCSIRQLLGNVFIVLDSAWLCNKREESSAPMDIRQSVA